MLAADREDESVASYYQPLHPGVLRLIHSVAEAARSADRELTICGEMAGDPLHTELLLGLGLRALSVAPGQMLQVKRAIRETRLDEARELAAQRAGARVGRGGRGAAELPPRAARRVSERPRRAAAHRSSAAAHLLVRAARHGRSRARPHRRGKGAARRER